MTRQHIFARMGLTMVAAIAAAASLSAAPKVTATLDSAYIIMGRQTTLHLETLAPEGNYIELLLPADTITTNVEISSVEADTARSNGMITLRHNIVLQSFDSGLYAIPPVKVRIGADTALSNHLVLKVIPVPVDSLNGQIHDYADVIAPRRSLWDFIPSWLMGSIGIVLLVVILVSAAFAIYYYMTVVRRKIEARREIIVPPYDEARQALDRLRDEHLCEKGHEREFYTRLTDILRVYLDRRFGISAMEMTSSDILRALSSNQETRWSRSQIEEVLAMADFVKFAKMRPLPDDNVKTFRIVSEFVDKTRPEPQSEDNAESVKPTSTK